MNRATALAKERMNEKRLRYKEERELADIEQAGGEYLSEKSGKQSVGGMLGGLGGSMLMKYLASAALTAATGGAAGPAAMAMLTGLSHAAPALGSGLGSLAGSKAYGGTAKSDKLRGLASKISSRGLMGAAGDTAGGVESQLDAGALKGALKAGASAALLGGTGEWINKAKDTGLANLGEKVLAGTSDKIANINELAQYTAGLKEAQSYGLLDALGAGKDAMSGLLGGGTPAGPDLTGLSGWEKMYQQGIHGVKNALPEDLENYKMFQKNTGGFDMSYNDWFQEYNNQNAAYWDPSNLGNPTNVTTTPGTPWPKKPT